MVFNNVTLFEINFEEPPFGDSNDTDGQSIEVSEPASEESSGGRGLRVLGLLIAAVALAAVARWAASRRGDDEEYETEEVEPGVERVEA